MAQQKKFPFPTESGYINFPLCELSRCNTSELNVTSDGEGVVFMNVFNGDIISPLKVPDYIEKYVNGTIPLRGGYPRPDGAQIDRWQRLQGYYDPEEQERIGGDPLDGRDIFSKLSDENPRFIFDIGILGLNALSCARYIDDYLKETSDHEKKLSYRNMTTKVVCIAGHAVVWASDSYSPYWNVQAHAFDRPGGRVRVWLKYGSKGYFYVSGEVNIAKLIQYMRCQLDFQKKVTSAYIKSRLAEDLFEFKWKKVPISHDHA